MPREGSNVEHKYHFVFVFSYAWRLAWRFGIASACREMIRNFFWLFVEISFTIWENRVVNHDRPKRRSKLMALTRSAKMPISAEKICEWRTCIMSNTFDFNLKDASSSFRMRFRDRPRRDRSEDVTDAEGPDSYSWADGCGGRNRNCRLHPPLKAVFCELLLDSSALLAC